MGTTIFFHEDFYRQIELIPEENIFFTQRSIEELSVEEGSIYGFKKCVPRTGELIKIIDRQIRLAELEGVLLPDSFLYSNQIKSGYGTSTYVIENTVCWGFERYGVFAEHNDDGTISSLWLCNSHLFKGGSTGTVLFSKLLQMGKIYRLILVDWSKELTVRISSYNHCRNYLINEMNFELP